MKNRKNDSLFAVGLAMASCVWFFPPAAVSSLQGSASTSGGLQELPVQNRLENPGIFSFQARKDDYVGTIGNAVVMIEQGDQSFAFATDVDGRIGDVPLDLAKTIEVTIHEVGNFQEESVGQKIKVNPLFKAGLIDQFEQKYCLPIARRIYFSSFDILNDGISERWLVYAGIESADFGFTAKTAFLPTSEVIQAYFSYQGQDSNNEFQQAILFRTDYDWEGTLPLANGPILSIHTTGHRYLGLPVATTAYFGNNPQGNQLVATVVDYQPDESGEQTAFIQFSGKLNAGDNLILLSSSGQVLPVIPGPLSYPGNASAKIQSLLQKGGGGIPVSGGSSTCEPPKPACPGSGDCSTTAPYGDTCGGPHLVGTPTKESSSISLGIPVCTPKDSQPGGSIELSVCIGGSVGVKFDAPLNPWKPEGSGSIEGCIKLTIPKIPGKCIQEWLCHEIKKESWEVCYCTGGGLFSLGKKKVTGCHTVVKECSSGGWNQVQTLCDIP